MFKRINTDPWQKVSYYMGKKIISNVGVASAQYQWKIKEKDLVDMNIEYVLIGVVLCTFFRTDSKIESSHTEFDMVGFFPYTYFLVLCNWKLAVHYTVL